MPAVPGAFRHFPWERVCNQSALWWQGLGDGSSLIYSINILSSIYVESAFSLLLSLALLKLLGVLKTGSNCLTLFLRVSIWLLPPSDEDTEHQLLSFLSFLSPSFFPSPLPTFSSFLLLFSCSVVSDSLWPHGLQHARLPCPSPSPWVSLLVYIHTHTNQYFQHIIQYISLGKEFFKVSGHWGTVWNSSLWCRYQKIIFVLVLS